VQKMIHLRYCRFPVALFLGCYFHRAGQISFTNRAEILECFQYVIW
jgi:hypothetical protein